MPNHFTTHLHRISQGLRPLPPAPFDSCGLAGCWLAGLQLAGRLAGWLVFWLVCWLACLLTLIGRTCRTGRGLDQNSCLFGCLFPGNCFLDFFTERWVVFYNHKCPFGDGHVHFWFPNLSFGKPGASTLALWGTMVAIQGDLGTPERTPWSPGFDFYRF